ncbi:DUF6988 family protein [Reinekea marinisedimentorum]|uniref:Abortive infection Abi-like protein n=1 Tax=Reinekea marinisedimentorum TaxID=230495 RepID=A0A4R3HQN5_9GAMM|nr:hypothetical protein [Reinekea marinisedimentorum]TCS34393.1 hypothetical protein BCF53_1442 [Reinekea marinisedimentorum]
MNFESELEIANEFRKSLDSRMGNIVIPGNPRSRLFNGFYHLASEHFCSLVHLLNLNFFASAGALLRSQYEATVRGLYFQDFSSKKALNNFISGKCNTTLAGLVGQISSQLDKEKGSSFYILFKKLETLMNEFNHGGMEQIDRRFTETEMTNNFSEKDKHLIVTISLLLIRVSTTCALNAAGKEDEAKIIIDEVLSDNP